MRGFHSILSASALALSACLAQPAAAQAQVSTCAPDAGQLSGAVYRICMPAPGLWNRDLVVFAHGFQSPIEPVSIPDSQLLLPGGTPIPVVVNSLGFAFAVSSYRDTGLVVNEGLADLIDLVSIFESLHGTARHVYLVGVSEGGLIAALGAERRPDVFDGALATCAPIGDFRGQVNTFGDFRVVFDYFFPGVLPPSPVNIPAGLMAGWEAFQIAILNALNASPSATRQLLRVTRAPVDPAVPSTIATTVIGRLWYNVFATNDAIAKLGGQPFDNRFRVYHGSTNDFRLNLFVQRFAADPRALFEIAAKYQTSGRLRRPLVTLHTTGDEIVPFWHQILYGGKVLASGTLSRYVGLSIARYGHCNFTQAEVLGAFGLLVAKVRTAAVATFD
jgi:pimeloyl-ACP methyl ester carboxylesterase